MFVVQKNELHGFLRQSAGERVYIVRLLDGNNVIISKFLLHTVENLLQPRSAVRKGVPHRQHDLVTRSDLCVDDQLCSLYGKGQTFQYRPIQVEINRHGVRPFLIAGVKSQRDTGEGMRIAESTGQHRRGGELALSITHVTRNKAVIHRPGRRNDNRISVQCPPVQLQRRIGLLIIISVVQRVELRIALRPVAGPITVCCRRCVHLREGDLHKGLLTEQRLHRQFVSVAYLFHGYTSLERFAAVNDVDFAVDVVRRKPRVRVKMVRGRRAVAGVHLSGCPAVVHHVGISDCHKEVLVKNLQHGRPLFRCQVAPKEVVELLLISADLLTYHNAVGISGRVYDSGRQQL